MGTAYAVVDIFKSFWCRYFKILSWNHLWWSLVEFCTIDYSAMFGLKVDSNRDNFFKTLGMTLFPQKVYNGFLFWQQRTILLRIDLSIDIACQYKWIKAWIDFLFCHTLLLEFISGDEQLASLICKKFRSQFFFIILALTNKFKLILKTTFFNAAG